MPVGEFMTTDHEQDNIAKYLFSIENLLKKEMSPYPKVVVTDFSYALINAVNLVFNNCDLTHYLAWCFEMIKDNNRPGLKDAMKVRSYLCSVHMLKMISRKVHLLKERIPLKVRELFLFCFTQLQMCPTFKDLVILLENILYIFTNKNQNQKVINAIEFLNLEISVRKIIQESIKQGAESKDDEFKDKQNNYLFFFAKESVKSMKKDSPFSEYFYKRFDSIRQSKEWNETPIDDSPNPFYFPELFQILELYLFNVPMWSGIMLNGYLTEIEKNKLQNNPVENYIGFSKNSLLRKQKGPSSKFISVRKLNIEEKYKKIYESKLNINIDYEPTVLDIDFKKKSNRKRNTKEKWSKKRSIKRAVTKGYYYGNHLNFVHNILKNLNLYNFTAKRNKLARYSSKNQKESSNSTLSK
jgi:hypothetical protein